MIIIKKISRLIKKEICAAEEYARCALEYKNEDKILADAFCILAEEKLKHMNSLHDQVTRIIAAYRKDKGDPPEGMQAIYDYIHQEQIDNVKEVKILLDMYKS